MDVKKLTISILVVFVLYSIINSPERSADLVGVGFQGVADAAEGIGDFMTELVN
ncbi:hypothetical protein SRB5_39550 [Streptomyces sp. RB5]|uniref:Uncharacterized protein n=1 Tax=Streptomyces smaragdinus TaxID=2585196 RepID=A0A7K0CJY1_9ACTN|nr:hypothetical protein [Streptomyces smaragdinus]MQY13800.1 hypothetical protein [Streptomyces smaragdinus]